MTEAESKRKEETIETEAESKTGDPEVVFADTNVTNVPGDRLFESRLVTDIMNMGFSPIETVRFALRQNDYDTSLTVQWLLRLQ